MTVMRPDGTTNLDDDFVLTLSVSGKLDQMRDLARRARGVPFDNVKFESAMEEHARVTITATRETWKFLDEAITDLGDLVRGDDAEG